MEQKKNLFRKFYNKDDKNIMIQLILDRIK